MRKHSMECSTEDMVYVHQPSDSACWEYTGFECDEQYNNQTSVSADNGYYTSGSSGYHINRAHENRILSQLSAFGHGHNSTNQLLSAEHTEPSSTYTKRSVDEPNFQTAISYRNTGGSPTIPVGHAAPAADTGPQLRFEEYNDNSRTWQPAKQCGEDWIDLCPDNVAVAETVESTEVDANHLLCTGLHQEHSINTYHSDLSPYPAQIEFDSTGIGEQTPTHVMSNQMRRPSLSILTMERSFPEHMYMPDDRLVERLDASFCEVPDNHTRYFDAMSPLVGTVTPVFSHGPHLWIREGISTVCQPTVAHNANMSPVSQTIPQHTTFSDLCTPIVSRNGSIVDLASNEYGSQSNTLSRSSSRRLSVSQEPGSPTPSEISVTPSFVQESLVCSEYRCDTTFTGRYRRSNLARHLRLVHCRRTYPCCVSGCPKNFRRSDARLKHLRIHHPELLIESASSRK